MPAHKSGQGVLSASCLQVCVHERLAGAQQAGGQNRHNARQYALLRRVCLTIETNAAFMKENRMDMNAFFNDLQGKFNQALENTPAKDLQQNMRAMMTQGFAKLDLVTREEFDIQSQVLAKTRARLEALEVRVAELEARLSAAPDKD